MARGRKPGSVTNEEATRAGKQGGSRPRSITLRRGDEIVIGEGDARREGRVIDIDRSDDHRYRAATIVFSGGDKMVICVEVPPEPEWFGL